MSARVRFNITVARRERKLGRSVYTTTSESMRAEYNAEGGENLISSTEFQSSLSLSLSLGCEHLLFSFSYHLKMDARRFFIPRVEVLKANICALRVLAA